MEFQSLGLAQSLLQAVVRSGYQTPTPIQARAIPAVLSGRDLMGCAQTGTGKTAAFALPTLHRLLGDGNEPVRAARGLQRNRRQPIRALTLAPTRELAAQIGASFAEYGEHTGLTHTVVYGGVNQTPQVRSLRNGVDILIATPGRLLDLMNQGHVDLSRVEILVLDEADQMLDMGFIHDLRRIVASVPRRRQTLMFSATMPDSIRELATQWLTDPAHVHVTPVASPAQRVQQSVFFVDTQQKCGLLAHVLQDSSCTRALVFSRTKHGADKIVKRLERSGILAVAIHGNKSQNFRERVLEQFKSDRPPVLVATDVAARGLDVDGVSHVINYDLPEVPEIYVHRIGRTGRAGADGIAMSFCGPDERSRLQRIERLTRHAIRVERHPFTGGARIDRAAGQAPATTGSPGRAGSKSAWRSGPRTAFGRSGRVPSRVKAGRHRV